jgi:hypothetical protein
MVGLDRVVRAPVGDVPCCRHQLLDQSRVDGRAVGYNLDRDWTEAQRAEESPCYCRVAAVRDQHIDHLAVLIDGSVKVSPAASDLDVGLIHKPAITCCMPGRPSRVNELRCKCLHPPVHRDVVNLDAPLGQQFFNITVGQAEAQIPAHRDRDDLTREAIPRRSRRHARPRHSHPFSLHGDSTAKRNGPVTGTFSFHTWLRLQRHVEDVNLDRVGEDLHGAEIHRIHRRHGLPARHVTRLARTNAVRSAGAPWARRLGASRSNSPRRTRRRTLHVIDREQRIGQRKVHAADQTLVSRIPGSPRGVSPHDPPPATRSSQRSTTPGRPHAYRRTC